MQIFQTFDCPEKAARVLDDKRVVKMMTESAQILSTAARNHGYTAVPYKSYQPKRKLILWAGTSQANYAWLIEHFRCLVREYQERYPKAGMKGSHAHPYVKSFGQALLHIPSGKQTEWVFDSTQILPETVSKLGVQLAYRALLLTKWTVQDKRAPTWKHQPISSKLALSLLEFTESELNLLKDEASSIGVHFMEFLNVKRHMEEMANAKAKTSSS